MSRLSSFVIASILGAFSLPAGHAAVLTKGVPARIMPLGDSITEGKFFPAGGYRVLLQQRLKALGYSVQFVGKEDDGKPGNETGFSQGMTNPNHEGYGSFRIDEIDGGGSEEGHTAPPIAQTLANDRPDVILMMLGTNDVLQQHDLGGLLGRLDGLVGDVFRARKTVTLVIASITPLSDRNRDAVAQVYNSGIPLIVAKYKARGVKVVFADMHGALDPVADTSDGIHPTAAGFQKMADVWTTALTGIAPAVAPPTPPAPRVKGAALSFETAAPDPSKSAYSLGFQFKVGAGGLSVRALGYLNDGATGGQAIHSVGIYDDGTHQLITPVVQVTTSGGDLSGRNATFTYVALPAAVRLSPGTYDIVGTTMGVGFLKAPTGAAFDPGIVAGSVKSVFAAASTLTFPDSAFPANDPANVGPNFLTGAP